MLLIDSCVPKEGRLWQISPTGEVVSLCSGATANDLLRAIQRATQETRPDGIAVLAGPGRFSSVRVGVLYANLLARWYRVPLYSLAMEDARDEQSLQNWFKRVIAKQEVAVGYIAPLYDREPNITVPTP